MGRASTRFERQHLRSLGRRIRRLRDARKWSLKRLSAECGVSIAAIQKIEAGEANPSLLTILAIVEVLGEPVDRLIEVSRKAHRTVNVTRGTLPLRTTGNTSLTADLAQPRMNCQLIALPARERLHLDDKPAATAVFGYVLDGGLQLSLSAGVRQQLSTGDSFHITAETPVEWINPLPRRSLILRIADHRNHESLSHPRRTDG